MRDFRAPRRVVILSEIKWVLPEILTAVAMFAAMIGIIPVAMMFAG